MHVPWYNCLVVNCWLNVYAPITVNLPPDRAPTDAEGDGLRHPTVRIEKKYSSAAMYYDDFLSGECKGTKDLRSRASSCKLAAETATPRPLVALLPHSPRKGELIAAEKRYGRDSYGTSTSKHPPAYDTLKQRKVRHIAQIPHTRCKDRVGRRWALSNKISRGLGTQLPRNNIPVL